MSEAQPTQGSTEIAGASKSAVGTSTPSQQPTNADADPKTTAAPSTSPQPSAKATTPQAAGGQQPDEPKPAARHRVKEDDEEIPKDAEILELTPSALTKRNERYLKKYLRERYGTDDGDEIFKRLKKTEEYEAKEEEARLAALSEKERMQEEISKERKRAEAAEIRIQQAEEAKMVREEDDRIKELTASFIKPKFWKHVSKDIAEHLGENFTTQKLNKMNQGEVDKVIKDFLKSYVEENPEYSAKEKEEPVKVGYTNGVKVDRPDTAASTSQMSKTMSPGKPNSMTNKEFKEYMASKGIQW